jgi:NAD(P)-dependent dehydrogenase (short-subunit alcohol dehydrogenase family)
MSTVDLGLRDKCALVTGAGGGIGTAICVVLARLGCHLTLCDIDATALERTGNAIAQPGRRHATLCFDLGDGIACESAIRSAAQSMGQLDIVIHAGARLERAPLDAVSLQMLQTMTSVNMWGSFFVARAAAQFMAQSGGGAIVLFSSQGAYTGGFAGSTVYSMTKAAVSALVKSLAREYAGRNVRVNGVAPGAIDTPMMQRGLSQDAIARFVEMIPMRRMGSPEEVALCCAFLASAASQYITGQVLQVNGGQLML